MSENLAAAERRRKYVEAFNATMTSIWKERIALLKVIDTGNLYSSVTGLKFVTDPEGLETEMEWGFVEYGLYQDRGTGREVAIGNPGDIGRPKVREAKRWFSKAYYSSTMNIRDFLAESAGQDIYGIFSAIADGGTLRGAL